MTIFASTSILVCPPCMVCGNRSELHVLTHDLDRYKMGEYVQDVWPDRGPDWRELVITGTHSHCWDELWADEDDQDDTMTEHQPTPLDIAEAIESHLDSWEETEVSVAYPTEDKTVGALRLTTEGRTFIVEVRYDP